MKSFIPICIAFLIFTNMFAQSPQRLSYQTEIRDVDGVLLKNDQVGMKISILKGSISGSTVYSERQIGTTNINGLVSVIIGTGTILQGSLSTINWANGPYYIKTETDPNGGTNYTILTTSEFLSVPYALHAKTVESISGAITETDPSVPNATTTGDIQYWNGSAWTTLAPGNEGEVLTLVNDIPTWTVAKDCNGIEGGSAYFDECNICVGGNTGKEACIAPTVPSVTNPTTGKIWMDRNLGASQVATSNSDAAAYGDLYQWGRGTDGHEKRTSIVIYTTSSTDSPGHSNFIISGSNDWRSTQNDNLWQGVSGTNNPCPNGYRLPTAVEWDSELQTWGTNDGAYNSQLKLTLAGLRVDVVSSESSTAYYWSSTVNGSNVHMLSFNSNIFAMADYGIRLFGQSVRCIKD